MYKLATFLLIAFAATIHGSDDFDAWARAHGKSYTAEERLERLEVFNSNKLYVEKWNQHSSSKLALNKFADMSNDEFRRAYLSSPVKVRYNAGSHSDSKIAAPTDAYNNTLDWRVTIPLRGPEDEGQCNGASPIVAITTFEAAYYLSTKQAVRFSQQQLEDCASPPGCAGGSSIVDMWNYISKVGVDRESCYPISTKPESCRYNRTCATPMKGYSSVTSGSEAALTQAVAITPVAVQIDGSQSSFQMYDGGVYYEPACSSTSLDHTMVVVGYGVDESTSEEYWIAENSWGTEWGVNGYIYMARNRNNNCGIATAATYPRV